MAEKSLPSVMPAAGIDLRPAFELRTVLSGLLRFAFDATVLPILFCAVAGYAGTEAWLFDMVTFFRPHVAALALASVLLALLTRSRPRIVVAVFVFAAAALPLVRPAVPSAATATTANFRVLTTNIEGGENFDTEAYRRLVAAVSPDIVVAQEVDPRWRPTFASLDGYSYMTGPELDGASTDIVASRYPLKAQRVRWPWHELGPDAFAMRVEVERPGGVRPLVVYAIHPPTPRAFSAWKVRNDYLMQIAALVHQDRAKNDVVLVGDWNTPTWSPFYTRTIDWGGLRGTEGAWPGPTRVFREFDAPQFLGTPIDHVAVSPEIGLMRREIGREFGSDHLPVVVDLAIPSR